MWVRQFKAKSSSPMAAKHRLIFRCPYESQSTGVGPLTGPCPLLHYAAGCGTWRAALRIMVPYLHFRDAYFSAWDFLGENESDAMG